MANQLILSHDHSTAMNCSSFILAFLALLGYTAADMGETRPGPAPVWESCTAHDKCRALHTGARHKFFCLGRTNAPGMCVECTQCFTDASSVSGSCQDACGHAPVHTPRMCRRNEDCLSHSFCDVPAGRCSPCSLRKEGYDLHRRMCPPTDAPTDAPTCSPGTHHLRGMACPRGLTCATRPEDAVSYCIFCDSTAPHEWCPGKTNAPPTTTLSLTTQVPKVNLILTVLRRRSKYTYVIMWLLVGVLVVLVVLVVLLVYGITRHTPLPAPQETARVTPLATAQATV